MEEGHLTAADSARLARRISAANLESVAVQFLGFEQAEIDTLRESNNIDAFRRNIIQQWAFKNPGQKQKQVIL